LGSEAYKKNKKQKQNPTSPHVVSRKILLAHPKTNSSKFGTHKDKKYPKCTI